MHVVFGKTTFFFRTLAISYDISRLRRVCLPGPLLDGDDRPDVRAGPEDLLRVVVQQVRLYCHHRQCIRGKEDAAH